MEEKDNWSQLSYQQQTLLASHAMLDNVNLTPSECTPHLNTYGLRICETENAGRSVFASQPIASNTIIEISPVLLFNPEEYEAYGRHTILDSYTFVWKKSTSGNTMALALGLGSLFNHHPTSANVSYELDKTTHSIRYRTVRQIQRGEELCICYGIGRMWWESPEEERITTPVSETREFSLFGSMDLDDKTTHCLRAPVDPSYQAPLWRVTTAPDPKTMPLVTTLAWAMDVPPRACSQVAQSLKVIMKSGVLRASDSYPMYSIRHLRSFRKAKEVQKIPDELTDPTSTNLSVLLCLEEAHTQVELASIISTYLDTVLMGPLQLYRVRVPTGPAPNVERLPEWSAIWPSIFLPPGAGIASKNGLPGSDAARSVVPVDREADSIFSKDSTFLNRVRHAFQRCLNTAQEAYASGEIGVGVYVTSMDENNDQGISVDAYDTRKSEAHPLRHAVVNAIRDVAAIRAHSRSEQCDNENGQDYLLTGLALFITHEPCVYCSMALIHSRVHSVYFLYPSPYSGGFCGAHADGRTLCEGSEDGGPFSIHEQSGLNHRYNVWRWIDPNAFDSLVDPHIALDI